MKEYLVTLAASSILYTVCDFFLPSGGIKGFAGQVMLIIILSLMIQPVLEVVINV